MTLATSRTKIFCHSGEYVCICASCCFKLYTVYITALYSTILKSIKKYRNWNFITVPTFIFLSINFKAYKWDARENILHPILRRTRASKLTTTSHRWLIAKDTTTRPPSHSSPASWRDRRFAVARKPAWMTLFFRVAPYFALSDCVRVYWLFMPFIEEKFDL